MTNREQSVQIVFLMTIYFLALSIQQWIYFRALSDAVITMGR